MNLDRVAEALDKLGVARDELLRSEVLVDGRVLVSSDCWWPPEMVTYYSAKLDQLTPFGLSVRALALREAKAR